MQVFLRCLFPFLTFLSCFLSQVHAQSIAGQYAKIHGDRIEIVHQIPSSVPKALLFLAHGCKHAATDWFPKSQSCPDCIGLPVERAIVQAAISRGYAVIAVSADKRNSHRCWQSRDILPVSKALKYMYNNVLNTTSQQLPLYLLGASSGGSFVGNFAAASSSLDLSVKAICVQIMAPYTDGDELKTYPRSIFVHMAQDTSTAAGVKKAVEILKSHNIPVAEKACQQKPLTPSYFNEHSNALSVQDSAALVAAFSSAGYLSETTKTLRSDPRSSDWRTVAKSALPQVVPAIDSLKADESAISELLNLAWAGHEITDEYLDETFKFFEGAIV